MTADLPLAFAFSAGLLATLNPCGFAMLPAYLSYFLGLDDTDTARRSPAAAIAAALTVGGLVSFGFLVVFGLAGTLMALGITALVDIIPWVALAVGVGVAALGTWLLAGHTLPIPTIGPTQAGNSRGLGSALGFGVSFALASLSCTLPVFLTVIATATAQPSLTGRLTTVAAYAAGMMLLLIAITILLALGHASLITRLRRLTPILNHLAGAILVAAGVYVIAYWTVILSDTTATPITTAERGASIMANAITAHPALWGAGLALTVLIASIIAWIGRPSAKDLSGGAQAEADTSDRR